MATPRFIYFDLGNVLVNFDHRRATRQMAAVAGVSEQLVWEVVFASDLEMDYERGKITTQEFFEAFCERTHSRPDIDALLLAASDIFDLNKEIVPLVTELREQRVRIGILSNTNQAHWDFITSGRFPMVQEMSELNALSYEMRAAKPDLAAYAIAAELAGVAPAEIFFTDDRLENVEAACHAGFDAVQFAGATSLREQLLDRRVEIAAVEKLQSRSCRS